MSNSNTIITRKNYHHNYQCHGHKNHDIDKGQDSKVAMTIVVAVARLLVLVIGDSNSNRIEEGSGTNNVK